MERGYVSGRATLESAEAYCTQYSTGEIAIAKDLYDKKLEPRFAQGLSTAQAYTPAQIACAKKEREHWDGDAKKNGFAIPDSCVDATFHDSPAIRSSARAASAASETPETAAPSSPSGLAAPADMTAAPLAATAIADAKTHSVYDVLAADKRFTKFVALVDFVGLTKTLKTGGPWTIMAPTNNAINRYPGGIEALKAKTDKLKTIITLHMVDAARPSADLKLPDKKGVTGKKWPTAQGRNLTVTEKAGRITINDDVKVLKADIPADNGLVYIVDDLIKP